MLRLKCPWCTRKKKKKHKLNIAEVSYQFRNRYIYIGQFSLIFMHDKYQFIDNLQWNFNLNDFIILMLQFIWCMYFTSFKTCVKLLYYFASFNLLYQLQNKKVDLVPLHVHLHVSNSVVRNWGFRKHFFHFV